MVLRHVVTCSRLCCTLHRVTEKLRREVTGIPLVATNRINTAEVAEKVLEDGCADMVSMARPFLADPDFVVKAVRSHDETARRAAAALTHDARARAVRVWW